MMGTLKIKENVWRRLCREQLRKQKRKQRMTLNILKIVSEHTINYSDKKTDSAFF